MPKKMSNTIVFPHLPKCSGASVRRQLENSHLNIFFDSEFPPAVKGSVKQKRCERRNKEFNQLDFSCFDVIFGHFPIDRYKNNTDFQYVTMLRDPLLRAHSHYNYWKHYMPDSLSTLTDDLILAVRAGDICFEAFLREAGMNPFYQRFLGGMSPEDFLYVGFFENYEPSLCAFGRIFDITFDPAVHVHKNTEKEALSEKVLKRSQKFLKKETKLYEDFKEYAYKF